MTVNNLHVGQCGKIKNIEGNPKLKKRLQALGCIEGTPVCVTKSAPFGDPLVISLRGFSLAIRKIDANNINIMEEI